MTSVDKIFVITSGLATDVQKNEMEERLQPLPWKVPIEYVQLETFDARQDLQRDKVGHPTDDLVEADELKLALTHWRIWQIAKSDKIECMLIVNEQIRITQNHFQVLDTQEPWDIIYMGRESFSGDVPVGGGLVIPGLSDGTFAYLISGTGIKKLLNSGFEDKRVSIQDLLAVVQGVHPDPIISTYFQPTLQVLAPMKNFIERDLQAGDQSVSDQYKPLHPQLFDYENDQWVKRYVNPQLADKEFDLICDEPIPNVYSFPIFTNLFCKEVIEEAEHYGHWTNYRYKDDGSHASIDLMLKSIGLDDIYKNVLRKFVHPLFQHKYQLNPQISDTLDSQHFVVRYVAEEQRHLGLHNDACDISMIVTLNTEFDGGGTFFPKFGHLVKHDQPGYASIHPGFIGYAHGARPITRGRRYILASFFFRQ